MLLLHMGDSRNTLNALLFIPDISGFTEFVHFTEIKHSKHIISELLEVLLDANIMDLQLAEIEGDALFFYKEQNGVNISELEEQIKQMYIAFHTHLKRYEYERICQCGACSSAYNLSLKFVCHYGEIDFIKVKETLKPYGSSVIQAHRLLKNEIPINEYALYTDKVSQIDKLETAMKASFDFGTGRPHRDAEPECGHPRGHAPRAAQRLGALHDGRPRSPGRARRGDPPRGSRWAARDNPSRNAAPPRSRPWTSSAGRCP